MCLIESSWGKNFPRKLYAARGFKKPAKGLRKKTLGSNRRVRAKSARAYILSSRDEADVVI